MTMMACKCFIFFIGKSWELLYKMIYDMTIGYQNRSIEYNEYKQIKPATKYSKCWWLVFFKPQPLTMPQQKDFHKLVAYEFRNWNWINMDR